MPHFSGERTPFQDPRSRAAIVGLGLEHNRSDIARAVLEGAGHAVSEAILTYEREGVRVDRIVSIGGATQNDVIMETVSTVTGLTQEVASTPGASYGDAFLAAYGTGVIPDLASGGAWWSSGKSVAPVTSAQSQLQSDHEAYLALYEALAPWNSARSRTGDEDSA